MTTNIISNDLKCKNHNNAIHEIMEETWLLH